MMKQRKTALLKSGLALLLCVSMLIGSTFAWFTDSVTSSSNIIKAGKLDIEMYWTDDLNSGVWHNVEEDGKNTIFSYDNWEPGYTDVKYIKLVNKGNLALNYKLTLTPQNGVGKLAEVINVYFADEAVEMNGREDLDKLGAIGLLNNVLSGGTTADGTLLATDQYSPLHPSGETVVTLAMNMLTTAGNDYQGKDAGDFTITALATQAPFEQDAFGANYDGSAEYPQLIVGGSVTATFTPDNGKVPAGGITLQGNGISAYAPAGVALKNGADKLTLSVTPLKNTTSDITVVNDEVLIPVDVHVEGVAQGNTTPIIVDLGEVLPKYLNMGNYHLYHVENGANSVMTLVDNRDALTAHNTFTYDPLTGAVSVAMASFSEVALLADTAAKWEGKEDPSWYNTTDNELRIANADQLYSFAKIVGGMAADFDKDSFKGKTVTLLSDINLNHGTVVANGTKTIFYPVGYYNSEGADHYDDKTGNAVTSGFYTFEGTFDGNGHTVSNVYQNTWEMKGDHDWYAPEDQYYRDGMGLFGKVYGGAVKNLTVDNFESDGEITTTGCIAAYADGATFENIAITNCNPRVYNIGNGGIVGCVGWYAKEASLKTTFKNITVDNSNMISALWESYDVACGGIVGQYYPTSGQTSAGAPKNAGVHFENCHIAAQMDVYNDVCANYQYYAYRYTGMLIGSVRENETIGGYVYPKMDGITAAKCTVHFGDWNDYYYCELVANSLASYTHDHQFSRLEQVQSVDTDKNTYTNLKGDIVSIPTSGRYNYVVVKAKDANNKWIHGDGKDFATCYHFVDGVQWTHDMAGAEEKVDVNGDGVVESKDLKEDKQVVYLEFNNLVTGYGWGVTSKGVGDMEGVTILDREEGNSVKKFESKFDSNILPRLGNGNAVKIGYLFKAITNADIINDGVWVSINRVIEGNEISGAYTPSTTGKWEDGTVEFKGTGIVKITIQDYNYCTPTVLYLEVVDAVNATAATDATENDVVLLNDISGGFIVSGDHTFYGNGFTLNYSGNGQYLNNGLKQGLVTVSDNGILDNLHIKASIYPCAYLYYGTSMVGEYVQGGPSSVEGDKTRYHYQLSAVVAKGNATISNCYIYGGRTNVFVDTGNVTIENSVLENGTLANVQIQSTNEYTVTLEDVTTIQKRTNATVGDTGAVMLGAGVIVGPDTTSNPKIVLNGSFKQYNWVNEDDAATVTNATAKMIINGALDAVDFNHTVNGKTASNLGIIYMNTEEIEVTNNTGLPYAEAEVTMNYNNATAKGKVYSLQNAEAAQIYSDIENADRKTVQGDYLPTFNFDLGVQEISYDGSEDTRYLYGDANGVNALYKDGESPLTLDLSKLATICKYSGFNYEYTAVCKDSSGNALTPTNGVVTLDAQGSYTLEFTAQDNIFYDKNGSKIEKSEERIFMVPLKLTVKAADIKNAAVNITKTALDGVYTTVNLTDYKLRVNFLDCISVTDYDNKGTGTTVDLTSNISSATLTPSGVNVFTTASTVTITYTDGRVLTVNLSKISGSSPGTKTATVNTSGGVYFITDGALNNKPTEESSQNICTITSVSYKGNSGSTVTNDTDVTVTWELGSSSGGGTCLAEGTQITLADGSQVRVDALKGDEMLLVWNLETGTYEAAPIVFIDSEEETVYEIIHLYFSDGSDVKVISEHGFFDLDLGKYVYIDAKNYADYVGHRFVAQGDIAANSWNVVTLDEVVIETEVTTAWSPVTFEHLCYYTNGVLSMPGGIEGLFNIFEVDTDTMAYDVQQMQKDIETYGLFTLEDFGGLIPEIAFEAFNGDWLKVAMGKGLLTWEDIAYMAERYMPLM